MKFWEKIKTLVGTKTEPTQTDEAMVTERGADFVRPPEQ